MNWLSDVSLPLNCSAQIRYRQQAQSCKVELTDEVVHITFDQPQRAITPGQVCALYDGDRVIGSGIIS